MSDAPSLSSLSSLYRESRERLCAFALDAADRSATPVPATPPWTVHDAIAHLTGVAEDVVAGRVPSGGPTPEWTSGHVRRGSDLSLEDLVQRWNDQAPGVEKLLDARPMWPVALDVGAHEQDVRAALGNREARESAIVTDGTAWLLKALRVPQPLVVRTELTEVRVGPEGGAEPVTLTTTTFEAFRWRLGRRSRSQLAAMDWSSDPEPFLDHLCVFGPSPLDVLE